MILAMSHPQERDFPRPPLLPRGIAEAPPAVEDHHHHHHHRNNQHTVISITLKFQDEAPRQAHVHATNTFCDVKDAIRTTFGLESTTKLAVTRNRNAQHSPLTVDNVTAATAFLQDGDTLHVTVSTASPKKTARFVKILRQTSKRCGGRHHHRRRHHPHRSSSSLSEGSSSFATTTTTGRGAGLAPLRDDSIRSAQTTMTTTIAASPPASPASLRDSRSSAFASSFALPPPAYQRSYSTGSVTFAHGNTPPPSPRALSASVSAISIPTAYTVAEPISTTLFAPSSSSVLLQEEEEEEGNTDDENENGTHASSVHLHDDPDISNHSANFVVIEEEEQEEEEMLMMNEEDIKLASSSSFLDSSDTYRYSPSLSSPPVHHGLRRAVSDNAVVLSDNTSTGAATAIGAAVVVEQQEEGRDNYGEDYKPIEDGAAALPPPSSSGPPRPYLNNGNDNNHTSRHGRAVSGGSATMAKATASASFTAGTTMANPTRASSSSSVLTRSGSVNGIVSAHQQPQPHPSGDGRNSIHKAFLCPLLLCLMADPVTAEDGYTYERSSIERYFDSLRQDDSVGDDVILRSPVTRDVMSGVLVPNRLIEEMIVTVVEQDSLVMPAHDLEDWHRRRKHKRRADRNRAAARQQQLQQQEAAAAAFRQQQRRNQYSQQSLSRMFRVDRPDEQDRFGLSDSGLSVVLATTTRTCEPHTLQMHGQTYCAVGCCVNILTMDDDDGNMTSGDTACTTCPRCCRAVCEACCSVQVTDYRGRGGLAKPCTVCLDCVMQVTDVMASDGFDDANGCCQARERILREPVATRFQAIFHSLLQFERRRVRFDIFSSQTSCHSALKELIGLCEKLTETSGIIDKEDTELHDLAKRLDSLFTLKRIEFVMSNPSPPAEDLPQVLGQYEKAISLPLNLQFPSFSMDKQISTIQERLATFSEEEQGLLLNKARREEGALNQLCDHLKRFFDAKDTGQGDMGKILDELDALSKSVRLTSSAGRASEDYVQSIRNELCQLVVGRPDENVETSTPLSDTSTAPVILRMCPYCRTGPMDGLDATTGCCPNCLHRPVRGEADYEEWPEWDGVAGPH